MCIRGSEGRGSLKVMPKKGNIWEWRGSILVTVLDSLSSNALYGAVENLFENTLLGSWFPFRFFSDKSSSGYLQEKGAPSLALVFVSRRAYHDEYARTPSALADIHRL
ncbi:hypothetical protein CDL15_Pgr023228 [Punica granatum]|nr:hypothetical protein CDL15_Pgr023228 [Punica granatum]